ncbi:MAG: methylamine utilization protein [Methylophaga sp.]|nr:methylamine utilization protein [Methylophaga sp.]
MDRWIKHVPALLMAVSIGTAMSAETMVDLQINNHLQQPLAGAVIEIEVTEPEARYSKLHIIDQVNKAFVPEFLVIKAGDEIDFPNSDNIRHHVYSFSEAKTFELRLYADRPERPVDFPAPGVVLIGCNIHDSMIGYIFVANSRNVAVSDETGRAKLSVPEGIEVVIVTIWHPEQSSSPGFYPDFADTSKKPDNWQKECLCQREENRVQSLNMVLLSKPGNRVSAVPRLLMN